MNYVGRRLRNCAFHGKATEREGVDWDFEQCNESFVFAVYSSPGGIVVHGVLTNPMVQLGPIPR